MSSPISAEARKYVRTRATAVMQHVCKIERGNRSGGYDEETLVHTAGDRELIYEGKCRIWELAGSAGVMVNDTDFYTQSTNLSIPWDTSAEVRRFDEVTITAAPTDSQMVGQKYEIQNVVKGGELRATRRFQVTGLET